MARQADYARYASLANAGDVSAMLKVARKLADGDGVACQPEVAFALYLRGGQTDPDGISSAALMLLKGTTKGPKLQLPRDEPRALRLMHEAADKATYILGLIYQNGLHGVAKDPVRAKLLLDNALAAGQTNAANPL